MNSRASSNTLIACLIALLAVGALVYFGGPAVSADENFELERDLKQPFGNKTIKGAPFSAHVIFENTQTLSNGVHVTNKRTGALYRDSEGRTRQEFPRNGSPEMALINDGVAGVAYHLHLLDRSALKIDVGGRDRHREMEEYKLKREHEERELRERMEKTHGVGLKRPGKEIEPSRRVESLGVQTFEGVQAEVTRLTITIPAGMEGNDGPLEIVSERWFSPELQIVVMARQSDPRAGEMLYRLTNITRSEPNRSLFEAPADFRVTEEKGEFRKKESHN
jgi:hypothetical protein